MVLETRQEEVFCGRDDADDLERDRGFLGLMQQLGAIPAPAQPGV
jgi:hypothetical protein